MLMLLMPMLLLLRMFLCELRHEARVRWRV
jgi:hypothetical protein